VLIRNITPTIPIPHEPGNTLTLRKLTRKQARKATEKRQEQAIGRVRDLGGAKFVQELQDLKTEQIAEQEKQDAADPLAGMDEDALLEMGLVGWSGENYPEAFSIAAIDMLDEKTARFAAAQIVALYKGTLDSEEAARKNG
jgi:hypothetical protein